MMIFNKKGSIAGTLILLVVIILAAVIYFGYEKYKERLYITLYDNTTFDRKIDIPPFVERLTEKNQELIGECDLKIGTSFDQICTFYNEYCKEHGYVFEFTHESLKISLTRKYEIEGTIQGNVLRLRWYPNLNGKNSGLARKHFGYVKIKPVSEDE